MCKENVALCWELIKRVQDRGFNALAEHGDGEREACTARGLVGCAAPPQNCIVDDAAKKA
jgi:hypothetical protein